VFEYRAGGRTIKAAPGTLFDGFYEAARVATADIADYIYGAGKGYKPLVVVVDGRTNAEISRFYAFPLTFLGGVYVGAGDMDRDGYADVMVGSGPGMAATVQVYSGKRGYQLASQALEGAAGVRVAGADTDGDGYADIVTGSGELAAPEVRVYSGKDQQLLRTIPVMDATGAAPAGYTNIVNNTPAWSGNVDDVTGQSLGTNVWWTSAT
jgi:hypothetical protein